MVRILWQTIRPPRGHSIRRALALLSLALAVVYLFLIPTPATTTSYIRQEHIMPIWVYGVIFVFCGLALFATMRNQHEWIGRGVAVLVFAFYVLFAATFFPTAPTAILAYFSFAMMALGEASFVEYED